MATIRQKRAIKKILEENLPVSRAMREVGYSPKSAKDPTLLTRSRAWLEIVEKNGITLENVSQVHSKLLHSKREDIQLRAVDTAYKIHGVYDRTTHSTTAIPIQINIIPPQQHHTHSVERVDVVERDDGMAE